MEVYDSSALYIDSATTISGKIAAIDAIIAALLTTAATAAVTDHITEYSLDNGQTKIKEVYNGTAAVLRSINAFERLRQMYMNMGNGRMVRLVDSKNFKR